MWGCKKYVYLSLQRDWRTKIKLDLRETRLSEQVMQLSSNFSEKHVDEVIEHISLGAVLWGSDSAWDTGVPGSWTQVRVVISTKKTKQKTLPNILSPPFLKWACLWPAGRRREEQHISLQAQRDRNVQGRSSPHFTRVAESRLADLFFVIILPGWKKVNRACLSLSD